MIQLKLDFTPLIKKVEFISRRFIENEYSGEYHSFFKNKGVEFEDYKNFVLGDDATLIDWKASLRSGKLLIRQYTQTKTLNVIILLDVSNSMLFSSIDKLKCEYGAELAASLAYYFLRQSSNVGLTMFNDKLIQFLPPALGTKQFYFVKNILSDPKNYGGNFNLTKVISYLSNYIRQGSVVIIISDFIGQGLEWGPSIQVMSKKAEVIGLIIRDPQDTHVRGKIGQAYVEDPYSDKVMLVDFERLRYSYFDNSKKNLQKIMEVFGKCKSDSLVLQTDKPFVEPIIKFFYKRSIKWL